MLSEVSSGLQSIWIIQTVIFPGLVFYGTLRVIAAALMIDNAFFTDLSDDAILSTALIIGSGVMMQVLGSSLERVAFKYGPYNLTEKRIWFWKAVFGLTKKITKKSESPNADKWQDNWTLRYDYVLKSEINKTQIERVLSQYFMAQNITCGFVIQFVWVSIYLVAVGYNAPASSIMVLGVIAAAALLSFVFAINRFDIRIEQLYKLHERETNNNIANVHSNIPAATASGPPIKIKT